MRTVLAALLIALAARPAMAAPTEAKDYDAFFLWAGVKPQAVLSEARSLYLLQGQVEAGNPVRLVAQRPALPRIARSDIWMAVRVETLAWPDAVYAQVLAALARWRTAGNHVVGLQIDFDAGTRHLENYAAFLADLKGRLPDDCHLSITGLLDWSSHGDPAGLAALAGVVDEVVLQIYQGRRVIPGYAGYLAALDRLEIPFRIGLLQGGDWEPPAGLAANPWFRGYVVFLVNAD
uniref:DUF3142 domain-containing protein n=1 Tax=uncultured bacterium 878 TaxID=548895 RepID=B8R8M4_9BACT|nr:hypothetical protein [uncultured bacterium 878]